MGVHKSKFDKTNTESKKHLGIDDKGNINIIEGKSSSKGKKRFAVKTGISLASISLAVYIKRHPEIIIKGMNTVNKIVENSQKESVIDFDNIGPAIVGKDGKPLSQDAIKKLKDMGIL